MSVVKDVRTIKEKVSAVLERYPVTRDNDKQLWLAYMVKFCGLREYIPNPQTRTAFMKMLMDPSTPTFESIRRVRQKLQEEGKFIGDKRKEKMIEEQKMRDWARE